MHEDKIGIAQLIFLEKLENLDIKLSELKDNINVTIIGENAGLAKDSTLLDIYDRQLAEDWFFGYVWDGTKFILVKGYVNNTTYTYDSNGNLTEVTLEITDENGNLLYTIKRTYTYDTAGNLTGKSRWEVV